MIKITGLKELETRLNNLAKNAEALSGEHSVSLPSLLTPTFIQACSGFNTLEELFSSSGFKVDTPEDFKAIPDEDWDRFIKQSTTYQNWKEMLSAASAVWTKKQLGL